MELGVADGVVLYLSGCHEADHFLVLELVETEAVAVLRLVVVILERCDDALAHLKLYVLGRGVSFLALVH